MPLVPAGPNPMHPERPLIGGFRPLVGGARFNGGDPVGVLRRRHDDAVERLLALT
ncbi:hypothetical protein [Nocardiopsis sp. Huas11]|uniref:hypothetical protein n=1 Tax=Nocardiopsis sp. Huas11 TaxID=2183912 RepID=UPI0013156C35|nr:hypothetical protein [Nocardiopsis sp. Huas11]